MDGFPTRRMFLGGSTAAMVGLPAGTARGALLDDDDLDAPTDEVETAIRDSQTYLYEIATDDEPTHWDTTVRYEGVGDLRTTVFFALLTEHVGAYEEQRDECLSYLLEQRSPEGGWGDTVTNFGALLLFDLLSKQRYQPVVDDVRREIDTDDQSLFSRSQDGVSVSDRFRLRLLYGLLSDDAEFSELFPRELPLRLGELVSSTSAFDGRAVSAQDRITRPIYIGPLMAYFLLGATIYDGTLDDDEQLLVETAENVLLSRRLPNGAWNTTPTTIFATFALAARDYTYFDEEIKLPMEWISDNRITDAGRVEVWRLPVWDTGLVQEALLASGAPPEGDSLSASAKWLHRARTPQTTVSNGTTQLGREPAPYRNHHGSGWGYMPSVFSDWDDTAVAIGSLSEFTERDLSAQTEFLRQVQNRDGSWSAYTTDFAAFDSAAIADEIRSTVGEGLYKTLFGYVPAPDITGSALSALGKRGDRVDTDRAVDDGVSYLVANRADNGLWLGVWGQGYTYGTARVLEGVRRVGVDMEEDFVEAARGTLLGYQNADGGWGEATRYDPTVSAPESISYEPAASTPTQTGWALQALLYGGVDPDREAIREAVYYLLDSQQSDGSWPVDPVLYNFGGPGYSTVATTQAAVLKALGLYATAADD